MNLTCLAYHIALGWFRSRLTEVTPRYTRSTVGASSRGKRTSELRLSLALIPSLPFWHPNNKRMIVLAIDALSNDPNQRNKDSRISAYVPSLSSPLGSMPLKHVGHPG